MPNKKKNKNITSRVKNSIYRIHALEDNVFIRDLNIKLYVNDLTGTPISAEEIAKSKDLRKALTGNININGEQNDVNCVKVVLEKEYADKIDESYKNGIITFEQYPMEFEDDIDARKDLFTYKIADNELGIAESHILPIFFAENCSELKDLIKGCKIISKYDKHGNPCEENTLIPAAYDGMVVLVKDPSDMTSLIESSIAIFKADTEKIVIKNKKDKSQQRITSVSDRTGKGAFVFNNGEFIRGKKVGFGPSLSVNISDITDLSGANISINKADKNLSGIIVPITGSDLVNFELTNGDNVEVKINGVKVDGCTVSGSSTSDGMNVRIEFPADTELNFEDVIQVVLPESLVSADTDEDGDGIADDTTGEKVVSGSSTIKMTVQSASLPKVIVDLNPLSGKSGTTYNGSYVINLEDNDSNLTVKEVICRVNGLIADTTNGVTGTITGTMPASGNVQLAFEVYFNETNGVAKKFVEIINEKINIPTASVTVNPSNVTNGTEYNGTYNIQLSDTTELTVAQVNCVSSGTMTVDTTSGLTGTVVGTMPASGNVKLKFEVVYNEISEKTQCEVEIIGKAVTMPTASVSVNPSSQTSGKEYNGTYTITLNNNTNGLTVKNVTCTCTGLTVNTNNGLTGTITGTMPNSGNVSMAFTVAFNETTKTISCNGQVTGVAIKIPTASVTMTPNKAKYGASYNGNYAISLANNSDNLTVKNVTCSGLTITPAANKLSGTVTGTMPNSGNLNGTFEITFNEVANKVTATGSVIGEDYVLPTIVATATPNTETYGEAYSGTYTLAVSNNPDSLTISSITVDKGTISGGTALTGTLSGFNMASSGNTVVKFTIGFAETTKTVTSNLTITGKAHNVGTLSAISANLGTANGDGKYEEAINCEVSVTATPNECGNVASITIKLDETDLGAVLTGSTAKANLEVAALAADAPDVSHTITATATFDDGHTATKTLNFTQASKPAPAAKMYLGLNSGSMYFNPLNKAPDVGRKIAEDPSVITTQVPEWDGTAYDSKFNLIQFKSFIVAVPIAKKDNVSITLINPANTETTAAETFYQDLTIDGIKYAVWNTLSSVSAPNYTIRVSIS